MVHNQIHDLLEVKAGYYNRPSFIDDDPISVPHRFRKKEDIEISGFLTATISWGNRKSIIRNALRLMELMDHAPHDFITGARPSDLKPVLSFVHRTFNGEDCLFFLAALRKIYQRENGLEPLFIGLNTLGPAKTISLFRQKFLETEHLPRSEKHLANPATGSAAKRINMFLRWMVRNDNQGVDFGIWPSISPATLICPLDIHSGKVARDLGLLTRKHNDWQAAMELTASLRLFDPADPVKYDFALFGMGIFEH